jgi:hypothetical protein
LLTLNQPSGENPLESFALLNQGLLLWSNLKDLSDEDFALGLEDSEWQGTLASLQSCYQHRKSERPKEESEFLLCPTPTAFAGGMEYRQAGGNKLITWCRNQGLVNGDSQVLNADKVELVQGFPAGHTRVIGECQSDRPDATSNDATSSAKPLSQLKPTSPLPSLESLQEELTEIQQQIDTAAVTKDSLPKKSAEYKLLDKHLKAELKQRQDCVKRAHELAKSYGKELVMQGHESEDDGWFYQFQIQEKAAAPTAANQLNTQGNYTMVATFSGIDDYSSFPCDESIQAKSEKARLIRDQILAVDSEADYAELRSNPNLTREQLNWVRENLISKEERKALAQRIRANPLPKPVTVGDVVCDRSGQVVGTVTKVMVTFLEIGDTKLSWEDFETQGLTKQEPVLETAQEVLEKSEEILETVQQFSDPILPNLENSAEQFLQTEISETIAAVEIEEETTQEIPKNSKLILQNLENSEQISGVDEQTELVAVEIAGTSDTDEVDRIVEEIRDLDRSYGLEIARRLLRLQQIWKPSLEFPNFGDFCTARLGKRYGKSYRNELIAAAKVVEERLPTGVSGRLTGVDQATTISKVLNAGASPEQAIELIEEVLEAGSLSADKLKAVAQERGLLPKKQPTPIVAAAKSVGLSGKETQQLPDVPPNADIPPDSQPSALYNCCSQPELKIFCEQHTQDAIAQLKSLDWEKRFELRGIWAEFEAWLATCAFHRQIDAQGVLTLMEADSKAKIKWLESEVSRLMAENEELRLKIVKPASVPTVEWYTPPDYIEMERKVMGGIDLDPASNELAQSWIKAGTWYSKEQNGLILPRFGKVHVNPPYGRDVEKWLSIEVDAYRNGQTECAILLLNRTGAAWYKARTKEVTAICEVYKRIAFIDENGQRQSSPRYYNDFLYLGKDVEKFVEVFSAIGDVTVMRQSSQQQAA